MATDPRILGDLAKSQMNRGKDTSLDVERDLGVTADADATEAGRDTARDLAVPPAKAPADEA